MSQKPLPTQPEVNIGTLGHVDNGKSTLVQALTSQWTARHSEELKRGITIRIGYADAAFYKCEACGVYGTEETCSKCGSTAQYLRSVSFVDCPGHHSLMVTMLSGATLMDGALLILSATESCPQAQDREHLAAAEIVGIDKLVVIQNKIDVVERQQSLENFREIQDFVKGTVAEGAPIIPVSAQRGVNTELVIETKKAVENIDEILSVDGIDVSYIGPADLSASYGHLGNMSHPKVQKAIDRVFDASEAAGVAKGMHMGAGKTIMDRVEKGYDFITIGSDLQFFRSGAAKILKQLSSRHK